VSTNWRGLACVTPAPAGRVQPVDAGPKHHGRSIGLRPRGMERPPARLRCGRDCGRGRSPNQLPRSMGGPLRSLRSSGAEVAAKRRRAASITSLRVQVVTTGRAGEPSCSLDPTARPEANELARKNCRGHDFFDSREKSRDAKRNSSNAFAFAVIRAYTHTDN